MKKYVVKYEIGDYKSGRNENRVFETMLDARDCFFSCGKCDMIEMFERTEDGIDGKVIMNAIFKIDGDDRKIFMVHKGVESFYAKNMNELNDLFEDKYRDVLMDEFKSLWFKGIGIADSNIHECEKIVSELTTLINEIEIDRHTSHFHKLGNKAMKKYIVKITVGHSIGLTRGSSATRVVESLDKAKEYFVTFLFMEDVHKPDMIELFETDENQGNETLLISGYFQEEQVILFNLFKLTTVKNLYVLKDDDEPLRVRRKKHLNKIFKELKQKSS